ncbi:kinesin-like protein KIF25 [Saccoglossus kowalevskii]|uniref:Uncharacterized protein LOC102803598 n=1 Tax=Saccoglossus kowalevskii TaxID=10224 RepID=A0ABM0LZW3_SACKO|nr:PREDICTED: uncharacterized protein LOC102803598 [Saccoglossus kowalevskii]
MPRLGLDTSHIIPEKVTNLERTVRSKDERITALETENAMLYLKLAQLQGNIRNTKEETGHMKRVHAADQKFKNRLSHNLITLNRQIKNLKTELQDVRTAALDLPEQFLEEYEKAIDQAELYNKRWMSDNLDMKQLQLKIMELDKSLADAIERHAREKKRRRELHNTLVDLNALPGIFCHLKVLEEV